jgi:hypothetical protein
VSFSAPLQKFHQKMQRLNDKEHPCKKKRHNEVVENTTITHLSQDELSLILNYLPVNSKMFACSNSSLFHMIDKLTRDQLYAYDKNIPLSHLWLKYNGYKITDSMKPLDTLKTLLQRTGSFSGVTEKLVIDVRDVKASSALSKLFSIPTGRNTTVQIIESPKAPVKFITVPETMGHTLKHCEYSQSDTIDFQVFNELCKLESLYLNTYLLEYDVPAFHNTKILSELKYLKVDCHTSYSVDKYLSKLMPKLEILHITEQYEDFPTCFVDKCPNLRELYFSESDYSADVSDGDVLYMLEHLRELRKLEIVTQAEKFTGSAFNQIGKYAKKLQYLHICKKGNGGNDIDPDAMFDGGELPSLKYFIFNGHLELGDNQYDIPRLIDSVVRNCPNIIQIRIEDFDGNQYPCNLYGLVPVNKVADLRLYTARTIEIVELSNCKCRYDKNSKKSKTSFRIPGINAMDVITDMSDGWKDIAQSIHVKAVTMYEIPSIDILKRCHWINAHTLSIYSWNAVKENIEWFTCLVNTCPNIKQLYDMSSEKQPHQCLQQVLCTNNIWPDLVQCNLSIHSEMIDEISIVRPCFSGLKDECSKWEAKWLSSDDDEDDDFTRWIA